MRDPGCGRHGGHLLGRLLLASPGAPDIGQPPGLGISSLLPSQTPLHHLLGGGDIPCAPGEIVMCPSVPPGLLHAGTS